MNAKSTLFTVNRQNWYAYVLYLLLMYLFFFWLECMFLTTIAAIFKTMCKQEKIDIEIITV